jgi:hypothetical protein
MGRRYDEERLGDDQRPFFDRERAWARRRTNRRVRHRTRAALHAGEYDILPRAPRTEGWETW